MTYRRLAVEDYPPPGTMNERAGWMARRSEAFGVMSARYFKAKTARERGR